MANLTIEKIRNFNGKELAFKHARLMDEIEQLPPGTVVAPEKTAEINRLQAELYKRLYRYMRGHPLSVNIPAPSKKDLEFVDHQEICRKQTEGALAPQILFHFEVFSSINTRIDRFTVPAATKAEAWKEARERAEKYPGQVNLRIS